MTLKFPFSAGFELKSVRDSLQKLPEKRTKSLFFFECWCLRLRKGDVNI